MTTPEQMDVRQEDRMKLTPEYLAMTPLQKWETLALNGLLGTDEPWIEDMRRSLLAIQATEARMAAAVEAERARCSKLAADYAASMKPTVILGDDDSIYLTDHEQGQKDAAKRLSVMIYETAIRSQTNG